MDVNLDISNIHLVVFSLPCVKVKGAPGANRRERLGKYNQGLVTPSLGPFQTHLRTKGSQLLSEGLVCVEVSEQICRLILFLC